MLSTLFHTDRAWDFLCVVTNYKNPTEKRIVINNQTKEEAAFSLHKDAPILTVKKKRKYYFHEVYYKFITAIKLSSELLHVSTNFRIQNHVQKTSFV